MSRPNRIERATSSGASTDSEERDSRIPTALRAPKFTATSVAISCACLIVLDGWGIAPDEPGNAIARAHKPNFDRLWADYPHASLDAGGPSVGPPDGQMGNSEVGHLTIGAGAVVPQTLPLIDNAVAESAARPTSSSGRHRRLPPACGPGGARGWRRVRDHRRPRNAEHMLVDDGSPNTAHSLNRVPLIVAARGLRLAETGTLADVGPTVLALLGIEPPREMTGRSLLEPAQERPHLTPA